MNTQSVEIAWLDSREIVSRSELSRICALTTAELDELVEYGALVPIVQPQPGEQCFSAASIMALRKAGKLRADYDLDLFVVGLLVEYLHRIEVLEQQVHSLQAHLPMWHRSD